MAYVSFISDEHLIYCVEKLFNAYESTKSEFTIEKFYSNQIDPFKLLFDTKFFGITDEEKVMAEIARQIDQTISNHIGDFHENIVSGIKGYSKHPVGEGFDITDDDCKLLFADLKNKHNTVTGTHLDNLHLKLSKYIEGKPDAKSYYVQIISSGSSFCKPWKLKGVTNPQVYKVSADKFYGILTKNPNAFAELCCALPKVVEDFLSDKDVKGAASTNQVYSELISRCNSNNVSFTTQLFNDTFKKYDGFPINNYTQEEE